MHHNSYPIEMPVRNSDAMLKNNLLSFNAIIRQAKTAKQEATWQN
jgi:hypothetical protein